MKVIKNLGRSCWQFCLKSSLIALLCLVLSLSSSQPVWSLTLNPFGGSMTLATLAKGDAITDPNALLRNALPIDNDAIRELQSSLEDIGKHLRSKRWSPIRKDVSTASRVLSVRSDQILEGVPQTRKTEAETILASLKTGVPELQEAVENKDKTQISTKRRDLLNQITDLEELMVEGFPFAVPEAYANLPQLKGRATVEMKTTKGDLTMVLDGYSAPVNAGNFVDLVQRGFYDGLDFIRAEDLYIIQAGDPPGKEDGFIDPKTGEYRAIPLEFLIKGEAEPIYGQILEDIGIYLPDLALPFNAYGAIALAHSANNPNGGSSQFFFFKFDTELTPPGFNLLDGRYTVFGYVVEGKEVLEQLTTEDKIISAQVIKGAENLVQPS